MGSTGTATRIGGGGVRKVTGSSMSRFIDELNERGFALDSADRDYIQRNPANINGDTVTLYDRDNNEYRATFNYYTDGGRELINIRRRR